MVLYIKLPIISQFYLMQLNNFGKTTADVTLLFTWAVSAVFSVAVTVTVC
jgi:hypothetical protein